MMQEAEAVVKLENVSFGYNKHKPLVLEDINIEIQRNRVTGIIGPSGSGKSTIAKIISRIIPHRVMGWLSGKVLIMDREIVSVKEISQTIGVLFQDVECQLFLPTVEEEIAFGLENLCKSRDYIDNKLDEIIELFGLSRLRHKNPSKLSGGEKRIVAIAAVLALEPEILVLDEPFSELDENNFELLAELINTLKNEGKTIVIVEHDIRSLRYMDKAYMVLNGKISTILEGAELNELLQDGVRKLYLSGTK